MESTLESLAVAFTPPQAWRARSAALRNLSALQPAPASPALQGQLRLYQQIGAAWLWHLHAHQLGGILADEMGLGKTVQAIAFLDALSADATASALVVCPAALVENWCREITRFAPHLSIHRHHGTDRVRGPDATLPASGVLITSYGTLTRDLPLFLGRHWSVIIADEAQHIKNRRSQNAQSLRTLRAHGRFVLTGTPVENSLDDLRSLFAFLMPGYLPQKSPNGANATAREDRPRHDALTREKAAPYILRRTKRAVAPELPEKIEQTVYCEIEGPQAALYAEWRDRSRAELFELEMSGATEGRVRMAAFNHLLRLRQICAEPRLLAPALGAADSAKWRALREILDEALDGGHRILVFSQFVEVLRHLRRELDAAAVATCYMDGSTRDRQAECDRFNGDASIPVFLISLKAGGTGLNLTGADTVVHFDPWWNPAAEAQAADRAHRIGQTRTVTSIKLIAAGTVEERVLELQHGKAALLRDLFAESDTANATLGLTDLKALLDE
jgi:SNF2 family DNA or RNA helicase